MSLFKDIIDFLQSVFMSSSPEVQKKQALRRIETELKSIKPDIYYNDMLSPNVAEALRILYTNTKLLQETLETTLFSDDSGKTQLYQEQLILTGFDEESQEIIESFKYENRKEGARMAPQLGKFFENEKVQVEKIIKQMNGQEFQKIELVLNRIKQLYDISKYQFVTALRLFDVNYTNARNYNPTFNQISTELFDSSLMDLYYVIYGFDVSMSLAQAYMALAELRKGNPLEEEERTQIINIFVKIQSVKKQVFADGILLNLIKVTKKDPDFLPQINEYNFNYRQQYANYLIDRYSIDQTRIKAELQEENLASSISLLFSNSVFSTVSGYNRDLNNELKENSPVSFEYVLPLQLLKTFINVYYKPHVHPVMNDVAIEGYFSSPEYKSKFSSIVYAVNDSIDHIEHFEHLFDRNSDFDESRILGMMRDSHKNPDLLNNFKSFVDKINKEAKALIQKEANSIFTLNKLIEEVLVESKKPMSDSIANLRALMTSSRDRDNSEFMERQHSQWGVFLEIMKNYVIIGNVEKR